jgi:hypothetical protein
MDYTQINDAAEIIKAFQSCQNAKEQIELFEGLATRSNPPVDEFKTLLERIKLEAVLALTMRGLTQITNTEVKTASGPE